MSNTNIGNSFYDPLIKIDNITAGPDDASAVDIRQEGSSDGIRVIQVSPKKILKTKSGNCETDLSIPSDQRGRTSSTHRRVKWAGESDMKDGKITLAPTEIKSIEPYILKNVTNSPLEDKFHITQEAADAETDLTIQGLMNRYLEAQYNYIFFEENIDHAPQGVEISLINTWKRAQIAAQREALFTLESIEQYESKSSPSSDEITQPILTPKLPQPSRASLNLMTCCIKTAAALEGGNRKMFSRWSEAVKKLERVLNLKDAAAAVKEDIFCANALYIKADLAYIIALSATKSAQAAEEENEELANAYSSLATSETAGMLTYSGEQLADALSHRDAPSTTTWTEAINTLKTAYKLKEQAITAKMPEEKAAFIEKANQADQTIPASIKAAFYREQKKDHLAEAFDEAANTFKEYTRLSEQLKTTKNTGKNFVSLTHQVRQTKEAATALLNAALACEKDNPKKSIFIEAAKKWKEAATFSQKIANENFLPQYIWLHEQMHQAEDAAKAKNQEAFEMT